MAAISKTPSGSYRGVATSQPIDSLVDAVNNLQGNGTPGPVTASTFNATGTVTLGGSVIESGTAVSNTVAYQSIVSAGSTQLGATPIANQKVVVTTATASSKGVLLPVAATGLEVKIINDGPTFATKVYPNSHGKINAGASNAADATVLGAFKTTIYQALDTIHWVTMRGA